jgi:hypothetical protein
MRYDEADGGVLSSCPHCAKRAGTQLSAGFGVKTAASPGALILASKPGGYLRPIENGEAGDLKGAP